VPFLALLFDQYRPFAILKPKNRKPRSSAMQLHGFVVRVRVSHAAAASEGSLLFDQYRPFAILKPKNRKPKSPPPGSNSLPPSATRHRQISIVSTRRQIAKLPLL
jgi:hypothetical protein